jgi:hypothetical protein
LALTKSRVATSLRERVINLGRNWFGSQASGQLGWADMVNLKKQHLNNQMIIPYSAKKRFHTEQDECLFIQLKILCEGGKIFWNEDIDRPTVEEILVESEFQNIVYRGADAFQGAHFYKVEPNESIPDYMELSDGNMDLCWRTFYLVLKKSCADSNKFFFYLPCPMNPYMGVESVENIFKYILKVEFDIDIEL